MMSQYWWMSRCATNGLDKNNAAVDVDNRVSWMIACLALIVLFLLSLPLGVTNVHADADPCAETYAKRVFTKAAHSIRSAKDNKLPIYEAALSRLQGIIKNCPSTDLAVQLASGQSVGEISIAGLERQIRILENQIPANCSCETLCDALRLALGMTDSKLRNAALEAIIRKQVRHRDFGGATEVVGLILGDKRRESLRQDILRVQVRAALLDKKRTTCSCC